MPFTFSIDTDIPTVTWFTVGLTPSAEYDIPVYKEMLFVSPGFGLDFRYGNQDAGFIGSLIGVTGTLHTFQLGFVPMLHLKAIFMDKMLIRFAPFALYMSPWRYGNQGLGSDTTFVMAYQITSGISYLF